jgi:LysR family glycine cleavage system transcriptional activator
MLISMARLPLHTLPTFRTVARLANLRAAAAELHLTASALSQQIRLLEEQIGFELFERRGRRIVLNAAGQSLLAAVEPALDRLDEGLRSAAAAARGAEHRLRITLMPSFAQRWLLPRMARWRERHPDIGIELHSSQQVVDLKREGFHAALRQGDGRWRGLHAEPLIDSPLIAVGAPAAARRLLGRGTDSLTGEPLLGDADLWERWFALDCCRVAVTPVASFNDAGLMLQAAEQDIGIALARELLAADALRDGRLVRLSPLALPDERAAAYWFVTPQEHRASAPVAIFRAWLHAELKASQRALAGQFSGAGATSPRSPAAGTTPAGPRGSRTRAPSAARAGKPAPRRSR